MNAIATVISTAYDSARRLAVKVLLRGKLINGKGDVQTPLEVSPSGLDGNPIEGRKAMYTKTGVDGKYYAIGYLNVQRQAEVGAVRLFATNADGEFMFNIWVRANGEVLIGDSVTPEDYTNFGVKFNELKTEFNKLKTDFNDLVTKYNGHTHVTSCGAGAGTANATTSQDSANTSNIDNCKHEKVKYNA